MHLLIRGMRSLRDSMRGAWISEASVCMFHNHRTSNNFFIALSISQFGQFAFVPAGYPAEILGNPRYFFQVFRTAELTFFLKIPECGSTNLTGGKLGRKKNLITLGVLKYFPDKFSKLPLCGPSFSQPHVGDSPSPY